MNDPTDNISIAPGASGAPCDGATTQAECREENGREEGPEGAAVAPGPSVRPRNSGDPLEMVRRGDRASIARFVLSNGPLIRMRLRDRLGGKVRRVFDSDDLIATVARRMDGL